MLLLPRRLVSLVLALINVVLLAIVLFERKGTAASRNAARSHNEDVETHFHELLNRHHDVLRENEALIHQAAEDKMNKNDFCRVCSDEAMCAEIGEHNIQRSIAYSGTNYRLRRFLDKLRAGQRVTVAVVGGSVSGGHGLQDEVDDKYSPKNMHMMIFNHLKELSGRDDHVFVNDAQGGQGSGYFSYCLHEHIPDDTDLVLLELGINDSEHLIWKPSFEMVLRQIFEMPNQPAALNLQVFALAFDSMRTGGDLHLPIAAQYDVPSINLQYALNNYIIKRPLEGSAHWFVQDQAESTGVDYRHIAPAGHAMMANLANIYIDRLLCQMDSGFYDYEHRVSPNPFMLSPLETQEMPRLLVTDKWDTYKHLPKLYPTCQSMNSKHKLAPSHSEGWREWNWGAKHYLIADKPGSRITFPFTVQRGLVQLVYQRSPKYHLGNVVCWIDGEENEASRRELEGYWDLPFSVGVSSEIASDLPAGPHELTCEIQATTKDPEGGLEFRLISLQTL